MAQSPRPSPERGEFSVACTPESYVEGKTLFDALCSLVTDILVVCGAAGTREKLLEMVSREYESELQDVLKLALQFQRTAGERVVSSDFTTSLQPSKAPRSTRRRWRMRGRLKEQPLRHLLRTRSSVRPSWA